MAKKSPTKRSPKAASSLIEAPQEALLFNEYDFTNYGKFVPYLINYGTSLGDSQKRINHRDRAYSVAQSRNYVENIPEIGASVQRLADYTIGTALIPIYKGDDKDWAKLFKKNYLNKVLNRLTTLGLVADWQTTWQLVLKLVLTDGDLLMLLYTDRYGLPKIDFVEGPQIATRDGETTVKTAGKFEGYNCDDGVVYDDNGNVIGYQVLGDKPENDKVYSTSNAFLIYHPFSFGKGRGKPILSAAARHGRNMLDYQHYIPQLVKAAAQIQFVETNQEGKAPVGRTAYGANKSVPAAISNDNRVATNAVTEYTQAGIRYVKTAGGKLEPFNDQRPSTEVQGYITQTQKEMLCPLFPHQLLLSPETVGGPGARTVKDVLVTAIGTHRAMIEKFALIALQYVMSVGLSNQKLKDTFNIPTNFKEDWYDWSFTRSPDPVLDTGYEAAADIASVAAGLKSPDEVTEKEGRIYADVLGDINSAVIKKAKLIEAFQTQFPSLASYAAQMYGLKPLPMVPQDQNNNTQEGQPAK